MTDVTNKIFNFIDNLKAKYPIAVKIIDQIHQAGGTAVIVGGAVRDLFLKSDQIAKDLDIEIYGLLQPDVEKILRKYGFLQQVGKSFGVYLLLGINVDWSLPRTDSAGRKPLVEINPNLTFKEAFARRDLTINAMGINLKTGQLIDPFGGLKDLENKVLRYVDSELFVQDPLRFYRVMQFVGRLQMVPDDNLNNLCSQMDLAGVSKERIEMEFTKLFLKSSNPSLGLQWLKQIGRLREILPELSDTIGVPQNCKWHPEGDVFEHTKQALDCAARQSYANEKEQLLIMVAALSHDLGKAQVTKLVDGVWKSPFHAQAGVDLAKKLLSKITNDQDLIKQVCKLVRYHMEPLQFMKKLPGVEAYKNLAFQLYPLTIKLLSKLCLADRAGRKPNGTNLPSCLHMHDDPDLQRFVEQAKLAGVYDQIEPPVLQGRDLLDQVKSGPKLGELLKKAYAIQLQEGILDKDILKKRVLN